MRLAVRDTCSPLGQYTWGRKCSSRSLNQYQPPVTGVDSVTWSWASRSVLLTTEWLKRRTMGWPIPTVSPVLGKMLAVRVAVGGMESKWLTCWLGLPLAVVAWTVTV